jgi:hypothetical protein
MNEAAPEAIQVFSCHAAVKSTGSFEAGDAIQLTPQTGGGMGVPAGVRS